MTTHLVRQGLRVDILLIEPPVPEARAWLEARHSVEVRPELAENTAQLRTALYRARGLVLPRKIVVTPELLDFAPRLQAVARLHGATDNTDVEACRERGVEVVQPRTASVRSNAEYLLTALLMLYRRGIGLPLTGHRHADIRLGREINGSTVGLIGLAPPAQLLAPMLQGLGARLVGYDPAVQSDSEVWARLRIQPLPLPEVLACADAVSVQVMYASRFAGFIDERVLSHCRAGQLWVGISRSSLFDPQALARALADGRIDACVLDGAESGFASRGSPLHDATNLYLTPRLGAYTREARLRASWFVVHRLHEALTRTPAPQPAALVI
jgi:phosphoglycerate dehydrogenase-like enzyme